MDDLVRRLEHIRDNCIETKPVEKVTSKNEFDHVKSKIKTNIKTINDLLVDRAKEPKNSAFVVKLSSKIRALIKDVKTDTAKLEELSTKHNIKKPAQQEIQAFEQEVIELIKNHIHECEYQEKKRYNTTRSFITQMTGLAPSELPEIDLQEFKQIKRNDKLLDDNLDKMSEHLNTLKEIALQMDDEADLQNEMIDALEIKVDNANDRLDNINVRMKDTLKKIRGGNKIIIDFILLCILLGVGSYIAVMLL